MIKPKNDQNIQDWSNDLWLKYNYDKLPEAIKIWSCDCCGQSGLNLTPLNSNFRLPCSSICVSGLTYLGCSIECLRALFTIHHQYALSELLDARLKP